MKKFEILGHEMWECNNLEARRLWKDHPDDRWRICTHEEVDAHMMDDPAQVEAWIAKKQAKPGQHI